MSFATILIALIVVGGIALAYFGTKNILNQPASSRKRRRR